ncbi:hypothetical protein F0562_007168 [Nyssa sinensis]|uniref:Disease resistance protein At4g27190-like leucine-rich repeats domain-containing protein n=1 Tax=Nyssa sinensis TaxID=561372 RepID=A0A5J5A348_9ASTE|nr:hypothetical protein F0562_007168 [Nyssa sinensis]
MYHLKLYVDYSKNDFSDKYDKKVSIRNCSLKGGGEEDRFLLPHNIQWLSIEACHDVNNLCDVSPSMNNARDLKKCLISGCDGIECILLLSFSNDIEAGEDTREESCCVPLQSLEILVLGCLTNLSALIKWGRQGGERVIIPLPPATFSNLKVLRISECHKIKKLFLLGLLQHLQNLKLISVNVSKEMKEIGEDEEGMGTCSSNNNSSSVFNNNATIFSLPKLKRFYLFDVPKLTSICKGVMACDSIEIISLFQCPQLKRLPFSLPLVNGQPSPPQVLKEIEIDKYDYNMGWRELLVWDHPSTKNVLQPFVKYWD